MYGRIGSNLGGTQLRSAAKDMPNTRRRVGRAAGDRSWFSVQKVGGWVCRDRAGRRVEECEGDGCGSTTAEGEKWKKELFSPVVTQSASFERRLRIIVQLFLH